MKLFSVLFLSIFITVFSLAGNGNLKVKGNNQQYFKHDPAKGLSNLQRTAPGKFTVEWNRENSTPSFVGGKLTAPGYSSSQNKSGDAVRFISENIELFGLSNPVEEMKLKSNFTDQIGMTHCKFTQMLNSFRVYPCELIVHFNSDGSVESVNGNYIPTPILSTTPILSENSAIDLAKKELVNYSEINGSPEIIVFKKANQLHLSYEIKLKNKSQSSITVILDANTGAILDKDDGIRADGPAVGSGTGLNGSTKVVHTYLSQSNYFLLDASLPMGTSSIDSLKGAIITYDAQNDTLNDGLDLAYIVFDPNKNNNFNDNERLKAAVDAHFFSRIVYNFYKSHFNRNSFDDKGRSLINVVHSLAKLNNAYWDGSRNIMAYGDGDGVNYLNFAGALDIIGHEITHGVDNCTANLFYHNQSGAINESISDVFGCLIDSSNWTIGENILVNNTSGIGVRSMQDPHNGQIVGRFKGQPANMSEFIILPDDYDHDHGGVHTNSGIPNKAWYNVASVIGHWASGQIWYRALTVYLNQNSQFSDLRIACLSSAKDLYGISSTEYQTVGSAFDDVGITSLGYVANLIYDDGNPGTGVYESSANSRLAVKFTPLTELATVQNIQVYISGDANSSGIGHFTLEMFEADAITGLPARVILTPYSYTPSATGWQSFNVSGGAKTREFFVSVLYDGTNRPTIGADLPPGNGRSYEFSPNTNTWSLLGSPNDYTIFMRASITSLTSVSEIDSRIPEKFEVTQNYPNPFNPSTSIRYSIPTAENVEIIVYDVNGKKISELANNYLNPGTYSITWNGKNDSGINVASGIYYCKIKAGSYTKTNKMILLK